MHFCNSQNFSVQGLSIGLTCNKLSQDQAILGSAKKINQATMQAAGFLRVSPKSSFKRLMLSTGLWLHANMSTTLKAPNGLKDLESKKGQLSSQPPIPYIPVTNIVTTKEEPQVLKVKLPDGSVLSMSIYSRENTKE